MRTISNFEPYAGRPTPAPLLVRVATTGSTNDLARHLQRDPRIDTPHLTTVVAERQSAGRGRLGRAWYAPEGRSLTASVLLEVPRTGGLQGALPWFALIGALAARETLLPHLSPLGRTVGVKWPNDVLVDGSRKIAGLLAEFLGVSDRALHVVVGLGVNVSMTAAERPTPTATSLSQEGDDAAGTEPGEVIESLLLDWLDAFAPRVAALVDHDGDAVAAGIHGALLACCTTLGHEVTVRRPDDPGQGPDGTPVPAPPPVGTATGIGADGTLTVLTPDGTEISVSAGDVDPVAPT